jgi:acetyl esterase/lipase
MIDLGRYPPQEPLSPAGAAYAQRILALGQDCAGNDFAYGSNPYQSLTVFQPTHPTGEVLVFFHGGGWTSGYKEWMFFMAPALLTRGITFVSAGYRLAPQHLFPVGFEDCADAVAWVLRHIAQFGGDPARVFAGGHSAGGHYAALLAVSAHWRVARGLPAQPLAGCLTVSGVYRFGEGSGLSVRPRFLGPAPDFHTELEAAPLAQLTAAACPPFLMAWGSRDFPHLVAQAEAMAAALRAAQVPVQTLVLDDCDHFGASVMCGEVDGAWVPHAANWMRTVGNTPQIFKPQLER